MVVGEETGTPHPRWRPELVRPRSVARDGRLVVLLVDEPTASAPLAEALSSWPFTMHAADSTADALLMIGRFAPDVIATGPGGGRLDVLVLVDALRRHEPALPVIVGLRPDDGQLAAGLAALEPAALIGYPFRTENLARLLLSLAPMAHLPAPGATPIDLGRLHIGATVPEIELDGVRMVLPSREFLLLRYLAERAGHVVPRHEIGEAVWGSPEAGSNNTVAVHVARLRRRLGGSREGERWITAVRGIGYQLTVPSAVDTAGR